MNTKAIALIAGLLTLKSVWIAILSLYGSAAIAAPAGITNWQTLNNSHHGFTISYPAHVFSPRADLESADGTVFESADGAAKLIVAAFENADGATMREYRAHLLRENYAQVKLDYAPVRKRWFVLSGERDGVMFYERISFTCSGRLINSWAMLYPIAERARYDRILEKIARTYQPGRGANGDCR